jgi:hypothetical protein
MYPDELQLGSYEYAELEERHRKLSDEHHGLHVLASAYHDIVYGDSSHGEQSPTLPEARAAAGHEGLLAKALEVQILQPSIREAGGLHALVTQMQPVRSLIEQAGGLPELQELVSDTHLLKISVDEVGGLQGLHNLISEAEDLRSKHREYLKWRSLLDGPNGLIARAVKFDRLSQAFTEIHKAPVDFAYGRPNLPVANAVVVTRSAPVALVTSAVLGTVNPARANRIGCVAPRDDPDRDLYEPPPPVQPRTKTGSNSEPLGRSVSRLTSNPFRGDYRPAVDRARQDPEHGRLKRELSEDLGIEATVVAKRPRVDVRRASALVQASLTCTTSENGGGRQPRQDQPRDATVMPTPVSIVDSRPWSTSMDVMRYPIALWAGATVPPAVPLPNQVKKAEHIPEALANYLAGELTKYINDTNVHLWNSIPPNNDTCVLRYLLDGHRPSGQPQERRACRMCTSGWLGSDRRPCALLHEMDGVRMLLILPLRNGMVGKHASWRERGHYMLVSAE